MSDNRSKAGSVSHASQHSRKSTVSAVFQRIMHSSVQRYPKKGQCKPKNIISSQLTDRFTISICKLAGEPGPLLNGQQQHIVVGRLWQIKLSLGCQLSPCSQEAHGGGESCPTEQGSTRGPGSHLGDQVWGARTLARSSRPWGFWMSFTQPELQLRPFSCCQARSPGWQSWPCSNPLQQNLQQEAKDAWYFHEDFPVLHSWWSKYIHPIQYARSAFLPPQGWHGQEDAEHRSLPHAQDGFHEGIHRGDAQNPEYAHEPLKSLSWYYRAEDW